MGMLRFFIKKPICAHFIFIAAIAFGIFALNELPVEDSPNIDLGFAIVITSYPGAGPEEIERIITIPIEEAVSQVDDIDYITSSSQEGRSVVFISFNEDVGDEIDSRIMDVQTKINEIPDLPDRNVMSGPRTIKISTGDTRPILNVMLSSNERSKREFKDIAENLQRKISAEIPDVKEIRIAGAPDEEIAIYLNPEEMYKYGISLDELASAIQAANFRIPGGKINITGKQFTVKTTGNFTDVEQIRDVMIPGSNPYGTKLFLHNVASVEKKFVRRRRESFLNGNRAVSLYIFRKSDANIVGVNENVKEVVEEFMSKYDDIIVSFRNDKAEQVDESISVLRNNALLGMILVAVLLFLFLGWRASLLAVIGIPFAFLTTFIMMHAFGYSINSLSLFAMILVTGMLVDDAIVVIENVYRFREEGYSPMNAALKGTATIMWPVITAIATTISAFLPLLFLSGMTGKFLSQLPVVVTLTLIASLIEALIVLPVHLFEMKKLYVGKKKKKTGFFKRVQYYYKKILRFFLKYRYPAFVSIILLLVFSFYLAFTQLDIVMFGKQYTKTLVAKIRLPDNTPIEKTRKITHELEKYVLDTFYPDKVESLVTIVGRVIEDRRWITKESVAEMRMDITDYDYSLQSEIKRVMREEASQYPDIEVFEFMDSTDGPPTGRDLSVSIAGDDINVLEKLFDKLLAYANKIDGVVDLNRTESPKISEIVVMPNKSKLEEAGISVSAIAATVNAATSGRYLGRYLHFDGDEMAIFMRLDESREYTLETLYNLPVKNSKGTVYHLGNLVNLKETQSLAKIRRRDHMRELRLRANVDKNKTTSYAVNREIKKHTDKLSEEYPEYTFTLRGKQEEQQEANRDIIKAFLMAILLMYIIIGIQFNSFIQPAIIMLTVPFGFIGVVAGLFISQLPLSLMAMIAFVALAGIVVNDSIILVDFINSFSKTMKRRRALMNAGTKRLRPIILTTVTTIGGLTPMAVFATGTNKIWQPMAITMIWGLAFATVLTLIIIPTIYSILDDISCVFGKIYQKITRIHK
ncbi:MAG: efflux RND transporter permease subunit [bacterium]